MNNSAVSQILKTELEADVYRAVKAVQNATPENLTTEIEKQVYNAVLAAGGGSGGGGGGGGAVYSTSEQVIGRWIDGKPLYRKVVIPNTPTEINVAATTDVSMLNIETVTRMDGYYSWPNSNNVAPMVYSNANVSATLVLARRASIQLMVTSSSWRNSTGHIILEYTKTTDAGTVEPASSLNTEGVIPEATDLASLASAVEAIASMTKSSLEMSAPETVTDPAA